MIWNEVHPSKEKNNATTTASGIMYVVPGRPFRVSVIHYSAKPIQISNNILVTIGAGASQFVVHISTEYLVDDLSTKQTTQMTETENEATEKA